MKLGIVGLACAIPVILLGDSHTERVKLTFVVRNRSGTDWVIRGVANPVPSIAMTVYTIAVPGLKKENGPAFAYLLKAKQAVYLTLEASASTASNWPRGSAPAAWFRLEDASGAGADWSLSMNMEMTCHQPDRARSMTYSKDGGLTILQDRLGHGFARPKPSHPL
jgi:hypothetical protein